MLKKNRRETWFGFPEYFLFYILSVTSDDPVSKASYPLLSPNILPYSTINTQHQNTRNNPSAFPSHLHFNYHHERAQLHSLPLAVKRVVHSFPRGITRKIRIFAGCLFYPIHGVYHYFNASLLLASRNKRIEIALIVGGNGVGY